ncbi:hypothetical protein EJB05_10048 [Eragrostis curvula]|uniref:Uncharacterized protein n=1 Tax=Eragrostis curvula TaxID=38414 RepID=A0A5J9W5X2_9POAL|nr:hypothetical protein EJB05_10048 [Eragrostis curvula]
MAIEERFIVVAWKPREKMARHQARQAKTVKERAVPVLQDRKGRGDRPKRASLRERIRGSREGVRGRLWERHDAQETRAAMRKFHVVRNSVRGRKL